MGAIFGHLGSHDESLPDRMSESLAHRGKQAAIRSLPNGGFVGCVADDPDAAIVTSSTLTLTTHGTCYTPGHSKKDCAAHFADSISADPSALHALDADFAIAAAHNDGTLTLARDFFGCAPLYFARTPSGLAFASEYKALLQIDGFDPTPELDMLQHLQHGKRLPLGRTLFTQIEAVLPGTTLTIAPDGSRTVHHAPPLETTGEISDVDVACELIRETFVRALTRRTADLDTIGLALSGGIDSIALAFMIRDLFPAKRLVTVCAGSSPEDHECVTARAVAKAVGSEHHEVLTPPGNLDLETLADLVWHLEDPYSRSEALQLKEVGRVAAEAGCSVVLSAQGADGLFAGMPKYKLLRLMQKHPMMRRGLQEFWTYTQLGLLPSTLVGRLGAFAKFRGAVPPVPRIQGTSYTPEPPSFAEPGPQFINRSMARGFQAGVCQDIQKFERGFAAHGVEYRSPFYDREFIAAAYSIDDALKIKDGQEKWVFRRALAEWVPDEFLNIPKFPQRLEANLALAESLDRLMAETAPPNDADDLFEPTSVQRLLRSSDSKPYVYEAAMRLWTVILTRLWSQQFLNADSDTPTEAPTHG